VASKDEIFQLFKQNQELSVKEIVERLGISKQTVHIVLNRLVHQNQVEKLGRPPKTIYRLRQPSEAKPAAGLANISEEVLIFLKNNFLLVTETGNLLEGIEAFDHWCRQRKLPAEKTLNEYHTTKKKYDRYYSEQGFINGMEKLKNTKGYDKIWLDDLYYLDFYTIECFGKTRLGTLLHYAKQGQNKYLMSIMMKEASPKIHNLVSQLGVEAVGFVPPTIRREVQIMKYIQSDLRLALPMIDIKKLNNIIPVPQKSLSNLDERIRNAQHTFAITEQRKFGHVLLIDDAVGSGSTLNQIASKIKNKGVAQKITGLALVGSFKGFDVITDV
jgi:DeoR/GlpR family transcriptional regulator of sugar metabolism